MKRHALLLAGAVAFALSRIAAADSPIQTIAAKVTAPVEGTTWDAPSYTIALAVTDANGHQVAASLPTDDEIRPPNEWATAGSVRPF